MESSGFVSKSRRTTFHLVLVLAALIAVTPAHGRVRTRTIAATTSSAHPLKGQKHRSSHNFGLNFTPHGTITVHCPAGVRFSIRGDVSFGSDWTLATDVHDGTVFDKDRFYAKAKDGKLYLADPKGASKSFDVTFTVD